MVKYKIRSEYDRLVIRAKLSSDEQINFREMQLFSNNVVKNFFRSYSIKPRVIDFSGPESMSLLDYLKISITKEDFFSIVSQIAEMTRTIEINNLFLNKVVLDLRYVFVCRKTKKLNFIYLPIVTTQYCVDLIGFIESIVFSVIPIGKDDIKYLTNFIDYIKGSNKFVANDVLKYVKTQLNKNSTIGKAPGNSGFITDKPKEYIEHYNKKTVDDDTTVLNANDESTTLLQDSFSDNTTLLDDEGTTLLDEEGTTLLSENEEQATPTVRYAFLQRTSTNETCNINKPVFRIGKEKSYVDYFVANNNAVSRSHADIITRGTHYYVYDQNSKNGTYINDKRIEPHTEEEIFDGNILKLANEEFIIHI